LRAPRELISGLCRFEGRGACTDAERRAAAWLHDELRAGGHEAWVETVWLRPQWAASLLLGALLAAAGSLASVELPLAGAAAAAVAALSLALDAAERTGPLRLPFRRRATQHVLTVPPDGVALIVSARYDAARRGLVLGERWRRVRNPRAWLAGCAAVVTAAAAARAAGVDTTWLGAVQLAPTIALMAAVAAAADIALAGWSTGAGAHASAAAVALAVYDELVREPPRALAPALLLYGGGPAGRRAHLRREKLDAVLLELGPCAAGRPGWATRHPQLRAAAERAAAALGRPAPRRRPARAAATGRIPAIRVACDGAPGDDAPERAALDGAIDLALGIVDALDAELSAGATAAAHPA
jgi:hypothetical protein